MGLVRMSLVVPKLVGIIGQSVAIPDIYVRRSEKKSEPIQVEQRRTTLSLQ